jgi:hypothetical protein
MPTEARIVAASSTWPVAALAAGGGCTPSIARVGGRARVLFIHAARAGATDDRSPPCSRGDGPPAWGDTGVDQGDDLIAAGAPSARRSSSGPGCPARGEPFGP